MGGLIIGAPTPVTPPIGGRNYFLGGLWLIDCSDQIESNMFALKYNFQTPDFKFSPWLKIWSGPIFGVLFGCLGVWVFVRHRPSVHRSVGRSVGRWLIDGTWKLGNLATLPLGHMATCQLVNLSTWQFDNLATWQLGNLATWQLGTWKLGNL